MYGDQFGEFVCGYWGLKGLPVVISQGHEGVVWDSAAHASNQLCSSCVEEDRLLPLWSHTTPTLAADDS